MTSKMTELELSLPVNLQNALETKAIELGFDTTCDLIVNLAENIVMGNIVLEFTGTRQYRDNSL